MSSCLIGQVVSIQGNELIIEAFKQTRENQIGDLPYIGAFKQVLIDVTSAAAS